MLTTFVDNYEDATVNSPRVRTLRHRAGTNWLDPAAAWEDAQTLSEGDGFAPLPLLRQDGAAAAVWRDSTPGVSAVTADTLADPFAPAGPLAVLPGPNSPVPFASGGGALVAGWRLNSPTGASGLYTRTAEIATPAPPPAPGPGAPSPAPPPPQSTGQAPSPPSAQPQPKLIARLLGARTFCPKPGKKSKPKWCRPSITLTVDRSATATVTVFKLVKGKRVRFGRFTGAVSPPRRKLLVPKRVGGKRIKPGKYVLAARLPEDGLLLRVVVVR